MAGFGKSGHICVNKSRNYKFCWWTKSLAVATRRKQELFLKFKQTRNNADYCKYAHQRNLTKAKIREAQRNYEKSLVDNLHVNPRPFYSYIKSKQKVKDTIGHLRKDDGSFTESNNEAATILNSCFKSNFVTEESTVPLNFTTRIHNSISDIDLNI